jgi:hypothetical protein
MPLRRFQSRFGVEEGVLIGEGLVGGVVYVDQDQVVALLGRRREDAVDVSLDDRKARLERARSESVW